MMDDDDDNISMNASAFGSDESVEKVTFKTKQQKARLSGKSYLTQKKQNRREIAAKQPAPLQVFCKCKYSCREIVDMKTQLFEEYRQPDLNQQGNYLMGLIEVLPIQRRRHRTYNEDAESRR